MKEFRLDYSYHNVPEHTREALENYFFHGYEPGRFVTAVLCNDLIAACTSCDHINRDSIVDIVKWIVHRAPMGAWGNQMAVADWIKDVGGRRTAYVDEFEKRLMWETLAEK